MLEGGADIRYIQVFLGHADLNTTELYTTQLCTTQLCTHVSISALKAVHERGHPGPLRAAPDVRQRAWRVGAAGRRPAGRNRRRRRRELTRARERP